MPHASLSQTSGPSGLALTAALVVVLTLSGCGGDDPDSASGEPSAGSKATAAEGSTPGEGETSGSATNESCLARKVNPGKPVPGATFAGCVTEAMRLSQTAQLTTTYTNGDGSSGPVRFAPTVATHQKYSDGKELIVIGDDVWYHGDEPGFARPGDSSGDGAVASGVAAGFKVLVNLRVFRQMLASSSDWRPTTTKEVDGVRATGYQGKDVALTGFPPCSKYVVWVDSLDRPVRVESTCSAGGYTAEGLQEFTGWGDDVEIEPPS